MKVAKFALVGGLGFGLDAILFVFLLHLARLFNLEEAVLLARLLAFWLTASFTWLGNKYFTFQCQQNDQLLRQWLRHMACAHSSGVINLLTFYIVSQFAHLSIAFTAGVVLAAFANYFLSNVFVFTQQKTPGDGTY